MGALLNLWRRPPPRTAPEEWEEVRGTRCVFVGDTAGKTQLFRRVVGLPFQHTNLDEFGAFEYKTLACRDGEHLLLLLFDAGSAYDQAPVDRTAYLFTLTRGVQVVWVVFDLTRRQTLQVLEGHMTSLKSNVGRGAVTALVGNKSDLGGQREVSESEAREFAARHGLHAYFETSARTGAHVEDMFYGLLQQHARRPVVRPDPSPPSQPPLPSQPSLPSQPPLPSQSLLPSQPSPPSQPPLPSPVPTHPIPTHPIPTHPASSYPASSVQETSQDLAGSCLEEGGLVCCPGGRGGSSLGGRGGSYIRDGVRGPSSSTPRQRRDSSVVGDLPCYNMAARPRGVCLIINNEHFRPATPPGEAGTPPGGREESEAGEWLADRAGSGVDAQQLERTFAALHFSVRVLHDQSDADMERALRLLSLEDHGSRDCLAVCVLSHGSLGRVYGVNGGAIRVSELTAHFRARPCPSLAGKPKLFFLQTCQGRQHLRGLKVKDEHETDAPSSSGSDGIIPDEADFLLGYATVPGYAALRNTSQGSWYISALCKTLEEYGDDLDILNILVKVNSCVSQKAAMIDGELVTQVPAPLFTLTRRLLLSK